MQTQEVGNRLARGRLVSGEEGERVPALAFLALWLVVEQGFQFIRAFGHQWSFTMHQNLHDCTLFATAEDSPTMSDVQVGLV